MRVKVKVFSWSMTLLKLKSQYILQKKITLKVWAKILMELGVVYHFLQIVYNVKKMKKKIDHMFVHCSFPLKVWARILMELGVVWVTPVLARSFWFRSWAVFE